MAEDVDALNRLVGRVVSAVMVDAETQHYLGFETDKGAVWFEAQGDCCSESWFADIINAKALIGNKVMSVRGLDSIRLGDAPRTRQESDWWYGFEVQARWGSCIIAFRNSSNGYYGGWLQDSEEPGGRMFSITGDWSA